MSDVDRPPPPDADLRGPQRRDYELDDVVEIDTPERLKAIADPLRSRICDLVLERAYSVTELGELLGRPRGTIAYHVDVLVDAGLLKVARTRRVRAVEERFYGRTARTYLLDHPTDDQPLGFLNDVLHEVDRELLSRPIAGHEEPPAWTTATLTTYRRARIPAERAAEYARRLSELTIEFVDEPRDGDVEFGLYVAMFPTNRRRSGRAGTPAAPDAPDDESSPA